MRQVPQRIKMKTVEQLWARVIELENALEKCAHERAELDAAFTSLSQLVYENQPRLLRAEIAPRKQESEAMK